MIAVLLSADWNRRLEPVLLDQAAVLLPLFDKPFLHHQLDQLAHCGCTRVFLVGPGLREEVGPFVGTGKRWGVTVTLVQGEGGLAELLDALSDEADGTLLLGSGDTLPALPDGIAEKPVGRVTASNGVSTGWASLPAASVAAAVQPHRERLPEAMAAMTSTLEASTAQTEASACLTIRTWNDLLAAHDLDALAHFSGLLLPGREVEQGVWLNRNVVLHPSANVTGPIFLGEGVRIGPKVTLGPNAVVLNTSIVSPEAIVRGSLVLPHTYVGEELELDGVIALPGMLWNAEHRLETRIDDAFLLGDLQTMSPVKTWFHRLGKALGIS